MVEREVFLLNLKQQNRLSEQGECIYIAQSWKERRLLCESMFIPIERWTSFLKMVEKQVFHMNQSTEIIYPNEENMFMVPNNENNGDYYVNPFLSQLKDKLQFQKW